MKKLFWGTCFLMASVFVLAQSKTTVLVTDSLGTALPNASVSIDRIGTFAANANGRLIFHTNEKGAVRAVISSVGFRTLETMLSLSDSFITVQLNRSNLFLEPVEIRAVRAGTLAPFAKTDLRKSQIEKMNMGQDLPFLLNQTPSVQVTSDAGNGVGYTGIRIRGTDASRINVTVNGIPYNDAESQGTFFVDMPDIASSLNSIQIQRGVGTSSNGAGAFGASINLSTNEFNENAYAEINNGFGSFNTWKHTVKAGTGLLNKHFTVDARVSLMSSDGFIDRANTDLKSLYLSGAYISKKTTLRFNILSGHEKTYQAWNGVPEAKLFNKPDQLTDHYYNNLGSLYFTAADSANLFDSNPRTFNGFTYKNQTDNYQQDHYQFFINHKLSETWVFNAALYLTQGKGYYEEFKNSQRFSAYGLPNLVIGNQTITRTDLIRQLWLDNNLYGTTFSVSHRTTNSEQKNSELTVGGGWNQYDGKHFGNITWANIGIPKDFQWYYFEAAKKDFNLYAKYQQNLTTNLSAMVDVQYRNVQYDIGGTRKFPDLRIENDFHFFNPKAGLTYNAGSLTAYASYAIANKEPNRNDFETGTAVSKPSPEQLHDLELGVEENRYRYGWGINGYYMRYRDQLVLTGKINDVGDAVRINVPKSYRLGVELQGRYRLNSVLQVSGNVSFSENKILNFSDNIPRYDANFDLVKQDTFFYKKTTMAFSPAVIGSAVLQVSPFKNAEIDLIGKYVSEQYLDNSMNESRKIRANFTQQLRLKYTIKTKAIKEIAFVGQINNLWNKKYESNGYTYSYFYDQSLVTENFYFPMAGRNFMIGVNVKIM